MGRGPCAFSEKDVRRLIRAVAKEGVPIAKIEVDITGRIGIIVGQPGMSAETYRPAGDTTWGDIDAAVKAPVC
jgi:hypothetical protein